MTFADLHECLRLELLRRIEAGQLTGTRLAQQTGFRQAHISNFLNRKRALSLEGLDRVLEAQRLTVNQILPIGLESAAAPGIARHRTTIPSAPAGAPRRTGAHPPASNFVQAQWLGPSGLEQSSSVESLAAAASEPPRDPFAAEPVYNVPLVSPSVAMSHARIAPAAILECIPLAASRLLDPTPRISSMRQLWQRFVAIRVDAQQASAMAPLLPAGAAAVLDRHATSPLATTRSAEPALFAVRSGDGLLLRLVELDDDRLILRPLSSGVPVQLIPISQENPPADYLVGRIVLLLTSL